MSLLERFREKFPSNDDDEGEAIWMYEGEMQCEDDIALAFLFSQDYCLMVGSFFEPKEGEDTQPAAIMVLANDVFAWACADYEPLTVGQIPVLYMMVKLDPKWGSVKWCCMQRNMQPQRPMLVDIKKAGSWDEEFEALDKN